MQINKDDFESWLDDYQTKLFFNYLTDFRQEIINQYVEQLSSGSIVDSETQARDSEKIILLDQLVNIEFEDLENFYTEEHEDEDKTRMGEGGNTA